MDRRHQIQTMQLEHDKDFVLRRGENRLNADESAKCESDKKPQRQQIQFYISEILLSLFSRSFVHSFIGTRYFHRGDFVARAFNFRSHTERGGER